MKCNSILFMLCILSTLCLSLQAEKTQGADSFYSLTAEKLDGEQFSFEKLRGKTTLIVNTASKCGFTPQYEGLQELYERYKEAGLVILGFPSNQFGGQEPGSNQDIASFCKLNYGVTFPMFQKGNVKGDDKQPVYRYLLGKLPKGEIGWNFEKILVDKSGAVVRKFKSSVAPLDAELLKAITSDIES